MISKKSAALGAVVLILVTAFLTAFLTIQVGTYIDIRNGNRVIVSKQDYQLLNTYYRKLETVRRDIESNYIEETNREDLFEGAIKGMVASLGDPYSYYLNDEELEDFNIATSGTYQGIGVSIEKSEDNLIMIFQVFKNSPAMEAGLLTGDKIIKVDGEDVDWSVYEQAVARMKTGEPGSTVNITVLRDGEMIDYTVRRDIVELPDLEYEMLEDDIGYIWLYSFDGAAAKNFKNAIEDLKKKDMKGLVLDLRGNGGGLLEVCREIADVLLPEGLVVYSESRSGKRTEYKSDSEELGIPLVVLVNEYSASASEVLAGAVQDYGAGTIIGTTTYGKGVVQTMRPYRDGGALKLTTYKYFTPKGRDINQKGIEPDIKVEMTEEAKEFLKENPRESLPIQLDAPLLKGIEEIKLKLERPAAQ
ncbi:MAG: S41 family peptidase [Clostridiales bacterium]|jgi:carboxyl-terminal processing protease|nr:S41 family peptidase [Clostridiales bacterium]